MVIGAKISRSDMGLRSKAWTVLAVVLAAFATLSTPMAASASPWAKAQLPGIAGKVFLLGVSCPSPSLCVAVGTNNLIATSTDPTGGVGDWNVVYAGEGPSPYIPPNAPFISGRQIQDVSCPSVGLCVAVTNQGNIYSSTQPTGPAGVWDVTPIDGKGRNVHLEGVSCPTISLCVAVTGGRNDSGKVFTSTDPTGGAAAWQGTQLDESLDLRAVSCGSPSLCVAVGDEGRIVTSTNPTGGASSWTVVGAPAGPGGLGGVACVAAALCISGNQSGNLLSSTNPTGGLSSWSTVNGGGSVQITGVSCASATECLAADNNGNVHISTDPSGGRSAWSLTNLVPYHPPEGIALEGNGLFGVSCPVRSMCAVTGALGQIFTSRSPFDTASGPKKPARARRPKRPRVKVAKVLLPFRKQIERGNGRVTIRFYAKGKVRGFSCKLDRRPFRPCRSPKRYRLGVGKHVFMVRATGLTGLEGPVTREPFRIYPTCGTATGRRAGGETSTALAPGPMTRPIICS
jgi:hypothetical protein